jgi:aminopeptidase N
LYPLQKEEEFVFTDIFERPVPSLLRGYSAPIRLESDVTDDDLFFLLANDSDEFNRFVFFIVAFLFIYLFLTKSCSFLFDA